MLEKLLQLLGQNRTLNLAELARELDVSEPLVQQMLLDLQRMGYLHSLEFCQDSACQSCPLTSACTKSLPAQVWSLTKTTRN